MTFTSKKSGIVTKVIDDLQIYRFFRSSIFCGDYLRGVCSLERAVKLFLKSFSSPDELILYAEVKGFWALAISEIQREKKS